MQNHLIMTKVCCHIFGKWNIKLAFILCTEFTCFCMSYRKHGENTVSMRPQQVLCTMQLLLNLKRYPFFVDMIKPKFKLILSRHLNAGADPGFLERGFKFTKGGSFW